MLVDASVAFKWFVPEENSDDAIDLLAANAVVAPELVLNEVANALWKTQRRGAMAANTYQQAIDGLISVFDDLHSSLPLIQRAAEIGRILDHPIYDCVYLADAEVLGEQLITADKRLLHTIAGTEFASLAVNIHGMKAP